MFLQIILILIKILGVIGTVVGLYAAWNKFRNRLILTPRSLTIANSEWNERYTLILTNNKDCPLYQIQVHITNNDNNFNVDNIEILHESNEKILKLGDKNNYYTLKYDLILFSCQSGVTGKKYRILRIDSLEPHTKKVFTLVFNSNHSNKKADIELKISSFSKIPVKITEKENDIAIPFLLDKQKLWLRMTLNKK